MKYWNMIWFCVLAVLVCAAVGTYAGQLSTTWDLRNVVDPPDLRDGLNADAQAADARLDALETQFPATLTDGGLLLGSGTGPITAMPVLTDGQMIVGDGATDPVAESGATLRTSIGVGTGDSPQFTAVELSHASANTLTGSGGELSIEGAQLAKLDGGLQDLDTLGAASSDGEVAVATGAGALAWESGATLRTSIGVGTTDAPQFLGAVLSGSTAIGLAFNGTYTGNALDFSSATIDPTGSGGPCFIRMGAYGTEIDYGADNDQSGAIRLYTTCSGDISSYDRGIFACTVTTGAKGAFPIAGLAEANNTGTGPKKLQAGQFIAHLGARSSGAHLTTAAGDATAGMYGAWLKVTASGTAVCDSGSKVAAGWIDNQMSGTVSGEEYGLFNTTGASRPDAWAGFETTSSGYSQLLYFDETFNSGAGTCVTTDAVPGTQDARIMVYYNGTQYYIPLYR